MTDDYEPPIGKSVQFGVPLRLEAEDSTAAVGKLLAEATRGLATLVTSTHAQTHKTFEVDILVKMTEIPTHE